MDDASSSSEYAAGLAEGLKRKRKVSDPPSDKEVALMDMAEYAANHEKRARLEKEVAKEVIELYLEFDGASRSNPGPAGSGWCAYVPGAKVTPILAGYAYLSDKDTNNVAEYTALVRGLDAVQKLVADKKRNVSKVTIRGDSMLVVKQVSGEWKCGAQNLLPLRDDAKRRIAALKAKGVKCSLAHIPRAENKVADLLSNFAVDRKDEGAHDFPAHTKGWGMTVATMREVFPL